MNSSKRAIKPDWLKIKPQSGDYYKSVEKIVSNNSLNTICTSGKCPNRNECWNRGTATFLILGDICTRSCKFCATQTGKPNFPDPNEALKIARSIKLMGLKHCVITSVDRDDLPDRGANHWANVIKTCRELNHNTTIEVLIPDFDGEENLIDIVLKSSPDIVGHNLESVRSLTPLVRSKASYDLSLKVLRIISDKGFKTKSGLMTGLGESTDELKKAIKDMYDNGCRYLTVGQYLQPSKKNLPVIEYTHPQIFEELKDFALKLGYEFAECGPMVRSSYMAEKALKKELIEL